MKVSIAALCIGILGFGTPFIRAQSEMPSSESQTITDLEHRRANAVIHRDLAELDKITSRDSVRILPTGALETKSQLLSDLKAGVLTYDSIDVGEISVRIYGDIAVVTGRSEFRGKRDGKPFAGRCRFSRIWKRGNSGWQETLFQLTPISSPAAGR
jgi:ketosteroid isomerase-like protein